MRLEIFHYNDRYLVFEIHMKKFNANGVYDIFLKSKLQSLEKNGLHWSNILLLLGNTLPNAIELCFDRTNQQQYKSC